MAMQAETQAEFLVDQGHRAINQTGALAKTGFIRVNSLLFDSGAPNTKPSPSPVDQPNKKPSPQQSDKKSR
jgi:hypothetical protein